MLRTLAHPIPQSLFRPATWRLPRCRCDPQNQTPGCCMRRGVLTYARLGHSRSLFLYALDPLL